MSVRVVFVVELPDYKGLGDALRPTPEAAGTDWIAKATESLSGAAWQAVSGRVTEVRVESL